MKKIIFLAVILSLLFTFGCKTNDTGADKNEKTAPVEKTETTEKSDVKEITVGQTWVITSDDPLDGSNGWSITNHGISEYVYTLQADGTLKSRFVKSIEAKDETHFTAELNEGVKFADGSEVDAKAFCEAMNMIMENNEFARASAGKIVFTPVEDYKVEILTELPTVNLESIFAEWTNVMFKKDGDKYIFTGAYKIKELKPGAEVVLERNEYYDGFENRPQTVIIKAFKDGNALKLAYESGEVDLAFGLTNDVAVGLKDKGFKALDYNAGYQYYCFLNLKRDHLNDLHFRKALDLLLNRQEIIDALGGGDMPTGLFAKNFSFNGDQKLTFDVDKAKEEFADAGYTYQGDKLMDKNGNPVKLTILTYSAKPDLPLIGQVLVSDLEQVGIEASVSLADSIDEEAAKGNHDILLYAQNPTASGNPHYFFAQHFKTDAVKNHSYYANAEVDKLIDELGVTADIAKRDELSKEIQAKIYEDLPILYTVDPHWFVMLSDNIKNYEIWNGDYFVINPTLTVR